MAEVAERQVDEAKVSADAASADPVRSPGGPPRWRDLWQLPTLLASIVLLTAGLLTARVSSPGPDFDGALDDAQALVEAREFSEALTLLNDMILPNLGHPDARTSHRRRFHLIRGDAIYRAQVEQTVRMPQNDQSVIEEYLEAERYMATLAPERVAALADCLLALDRDEEALARIRALPKESGDQRKRLLKRLIEQNLAADSVKREQTVDLLAELGADPTLTDQERLWIVARETELRLQGGFAEEALTHLLRSMQRLPQLEGRGGGELLLLLAKTYVELGRLADAQRQIDRAIEMLPEADALVGAAHLLAGQILQMQGELEEAKNRFVIASTEFSSSPSELPAELGLAEVNALLGAVDLAIDAYKRAVTLVGTEGESGDITRDRIGASLLRQQRERYVREEYADALRFASLADSLDLDAGLRAELDLGKAQTHRSIADDLMAPARISAGAPPDLERLDPVTRAEARAHYAQAGDAFLRHARAVLLTDDEQFAASLWNAADSYDLAGEQDKAIAIFGEYAEGRPEDPRQPAALYRLAQAHMAQGEYSAAREFFNDLIDRSPTSGEGTKSLVPLAQCHLLLENTPESQEKAKQLLSTVVNGSSLAPDALEFREALVELGRLHLRLGDLPQAIRRLSEALERYPDDPRTPRLRFHLAEAYRRSAMELSVTLQEAMPETERRALEKTRDEWLEEALALYEHVRADLSERDPRRLNDLERAALRNATFYRADCAFDLGRYDAAIEYYDAAAQRFSDDPASLVAMMQIVNAYVEKGAWPEAQTANRRARQRLSELPDEAFSNATLPMEPRYWERWFESTAALAAQGDAG